MASSVGPRCIAGPHDLLVLRDTQSLQYPAMNPPHWVSLALKRAPLVVVRRAPAMGNLLPVGIRGQNRSERCTVYLPVTACCDERITPEQLVATQVWTWSQRLRQMGAIQALAEIAPCLQASGLSWGPTGSVGFELASGVPTATTTSDLDLLVRAPQPLCWQTAEALLTNLAQVSVRIDVQIETPDGAIALAEYVQRGPDGHTTMLLRTNDGPRLVCNPWHSLSSERCTGVNKRRGTDV
jgi:phosphoribosyl-dephospho-CoA transferase